MTKRYKNTWKGCRESLFSSHFKTNLSTLFAWKCWFRVNTILVLRNFFAMASLTRAATRVPDDLFLRYWLTIKNINSGKIKKIVLKKDLKDPETQLGSSKLSKRTLLCALSTKTYQTSKTVGLVSHYNQVISNLQWTCIPVNQ